MSDQSPPCRLELQKKIASKCNDSAWDLIEQPNLEPEKIAQLLTLSATARHHWHEVGTKKNVAHADLLFAWALARAGVSKAADHLARVAMSHFENSGATWERAFAHAAMAAACKAGGDLDGFECHRAKAEQLGAQLSGPDAKYFNAAFATLESF